MIAEQRILERVLNPRSGGLSPELARFVLDLDFPATDRRRCMRLSRKAQQGRLSAKEEAELDSYLGVNAFLMILQSKARVSLRRRKA